MSASAGATHGGAGRGEGRESLERRYRDNMALLGRAIPSLHAGLAGHRPRLIELRVDADGCTDLECLLEGTAVYAGDARAHARRQVAAYRAAPQHGQLRTVTARVMDEADNAHVSHANRAAELLLAEPADLVFELPPVADFMLMLGIGLGYHIEELLETCDVRHLCIVETELDVVHAALHTMDWRALVERFARPGRSLDLVLGSDDATAGVRIAAHIDRIGPHNAVRPFVYEHALTPALARVKARFFDEVLPGRANHLGYYDDERVGFAHTVRNYTDGVPVLQGHVLLHRQPLEVPAFVIANGPTLDDAIGFLREHRERAIVFSCGTALGSLAKAGLKPDFHVEMERSRPVVEWIEGATGPADRADVTLLALNTVHPEVVGLFPRAGMAMKANDVGTRFLTGSFEHGSSVVNFGNCNPTVGNCALAFAAAFGFRDVYLFGLDLGFPAERRHHSSLSLHYDVADEEHADLGVYLHDDERNLVGPGNLGGEVVTTRIYKSAAQAAHRVIASIPGMRCHNVGPGLRIEGAIPLALADVAVATPELAREAIVDDLYARHFHRRGLRTLRPEAAEAVFRRARGLIDALRAIAAEPVRTPADGMAVLDRLRAHMAATKSDPLLGHSAGLLDGSVAFFALALAQSVRRFDDTARSVALYEACRAHLDGFLDDVRARLRCDPLALDDRSRDLAGRLGATPDPLTNGAPAADPPGRRPGP